MYLFAVVLLAIIIPGRAVINEHPVVMDNDYRRQKNVEAAKKSYHNKKKAREDLQKTNTELVDKQMQLLHDKSKLKEDCETLESLLAYMVHTCSDMFTTTPQNNGTTNVHQTSALARQRSNESCNYKSTKKTVSFLEDRKPYTSTNLRLQAGGSVIVTTHTETCTTVSEDCQAVLDLSRKHLSVMTTALAKVAEQTPTTFNSNTTDELPEDRGNAASSFKGTDKRRPCDTNIEAETPEDVIYPSTLDLGATQEVVYTSQAVSKPRRRKEVDPESNDLAFVPKTKKSRRTKAPPARHYMSCAAEESKKNPAAARRMVSCAAKRSASY